MKTLIATLAAATLVAAPIAAAPLVNDSSNQLKALPSLQQRAVLRRAILDDGLYCRHIGPVAYQGPFKNLEMWTARCDHDTSYAIFIGLDASVQARACKDLASLKLPACKLPPATAK